MARPRKTTKQMLYDEFADFELADQEIVLEFLAESHRQAKRQASKRWSEPSDLDSPVEKFKAMIARSGMTPEAFVKAYNEYVPPADPLGEASVRAMEEQGRIDGMDGAPK